MLDLTRSSLLCMPLQLNTPLATCSGHEGWPTQLKFAPQGATFAPASAAPTANPTAILVSGAADWTARVWDASSGACQAVCAGHAGGVTALEVMVAGADRQSGALRVVAGAEDGGVGVWQQGGELVAIKQAHWAPVRLVALGDGTLVTGEVIDCKIACGQCLVSFVQRSISGDNTCCVCELESMHCTAGALGCAQGTAEHVSAEHLPLYH